MPVDSSYVAYMLRLRKLQDESHLTWVASIQSVSTGEQRSFANVEALATFLLATFHAHDGDPECRREPGELSKGD